MSGSIEATRAVVRGFLEALNRDDRAVFESLVADEQLRRLVTSQLAVAFPDQQRIVEDLVAEGDRVVARVTNRGTHRSAYLGIPPTGKQVRFTAIGIYRIAGGRIAESWVIKDDISILQQLGAGSVQRAGDQPPPSAGRDLR